MSAAGQLDDTYVRVAEAKRNYFGGRMSLRWWYRQVETGRLPHYRPGATVLIRPADIEAFVATQFRAKSVDSPATPAPSAPAPVAPKSRSPRPGGLRFFTA